MMLRLEVRRLQSSWACHVRSSMRMYKTLYAYSDSCKLSLLLWETHLLTQAPRSVFTLIQIEGSVLASPLSSLVPSDCALAFAGGDEFQFSNCMLSSY